LLVLFFLILIGIILWWYISVRNIIVLFGIIVHSVFLKIWLLIHLWENLNALFARASMKHMNMDAL
jgi:multisubunit Na+/H+ antiporter MnhC subunit